ncbi:MAG: hypothetical protein R2695_02770 [Acidimicrobiales bacterium]
MRGIIASGAYIPHHRLDSRRDRRRVRQGRGQGTRSVAGYDEDTTTMGAEAARNALRDTGDLALDSLWFATSTPAYLEKTNATAIHAALRLAERRRSTSEVRCDPASGRFAPRSRVPGRPSWSAPTCATEWPPRPTRRTAATVRRPW